MRDLPYEQEREERAKVPIVSPLGSYPQGRSDHQKEISTQKTTPAKVLAIPDKLSEIPPDQFLEILYLEQGTEPSLMDSLATLLYAGGEIRVGDKNLNMGDVPKKDILDQLQGIFSRLSSKEIIETLHSVDRTPLGQQVSISLSKLEGCFELNNPNRQNFREVVENARMNADLAKSDRPMTQVFQVLLLPSEDKEKSLETLKSPETSVMTHEKHAKAWSAIPEFQVSNLLVEYLKLLRNEEGKSFFASPVAAKAFDLLSLERRHPNLKEKPVKPFQNTKPLQIGGALLKPNETWKSIEGNPQREAEIILEAKTLGTAVVAIYDLFNVKAKDRGEYGNLRSLVSKESTGMKVLSSERFKEIGAFLKAEGSYEIVNKRNQWSSPLDTLLRPLIESTSRIAEIKDAIPRLRALELLCGGRVNFGTLPLETVADIVAERTLSELNALIAEKRNGESLVDFFQMLAEEFSGDWKFSIGAEAFDDCLTEFRENGLDGLRALIKLSPKEERTLDWEFLKNRNEIKDILNLLKNQYPIVSFSSLSSLLESAPVKRDLDGREIEETPQMKLGFIQRKLESFSALHTYRIIESLGEGAFISLEDFLRATEEASTQLEPKNLVNYERSCSWCAFPEEAIRDAGTSVGNIIRLSQENSKINGSEYLRTVSTFMENKALLERSQLGDYVKRSELLKSSTNSLDSLARFVGNWSLRDWGAFEDTWGQLQAAGMHEGDIYPFIQDQFIKDFDFNLFLTHWVEIGAQGQKRLSPDQIEQLRKLVFID